jgi:outer membrane protein assembly factor BamB
MNSPICVTNRKHTAFFSIASSMLAIAPLWLTLAAACTSAHAQTSDDAAVSSTSAGTTPSPADWTQFHRDNMQRWNPYETVLDVSNVGRLKLKWTNPIIPDQLTSESSEAGPTSPVVANGVVYVGVSNNDPIGLYALNASTGARLWNFATGAVQASPAVANGVVYFGATSGSLNVQNSSGSVYALNARTGAKLWSYAAGTLFNFSGALAVANGVVYVAAGGNTTSQPVQSRANVFALNASTGAVLWSYALGEDVIPIGSPAVTNGVVYFGTQGFSGSGQLYALNASTGAKLWSYPTNGDLATSPAVANGVVYFGAFDDNVYAINATTGAKLWSYTTGNIVASSPAVANGVVYIGSADGNVYALNAATGARLWSYAAGSGVFSSPAVANGVVYIVDANGIEGLNASTGAKLWTSGSAVAGGSDPTIVDGVVYTSVGFTAVGDPPEFFFAEDSVYAFSLGADLFLRIQPTPTTVHQGDLLTYAFPVWNQGPDSAAYEVLNTQVPAGTTFDYVRISGTPGLGTCTTPPYQGTGQIVCHENATMAPNTTWTVRLTVKVTAPAGTVITDNAATLADTPDPNLANNTATVSTTVQ